MSATSENVQGSIDDFNAAYGLCLDDDRLEQWPDLFVDDCRQDT